MIVAVSLVALKKFIVAALLTVTKQVPVELTTKVVPSIEQPLAVPPELMAYVAVPVSLPPINIRLSLEPTPLKLPATDVIVKVS